MTMPKKRTFFPRHLVFPALLLAAAMATRAEDSTWVQYFNGKDLSDWDIKFAKHALNENFNNTFKVVDGILNVDYSSWGAFGGEYGHAINKTRTYAYYLIRAEYQVGANQVNSGPSWALENNGLMLHSQSMATMTMNQDFPVSLEAQLLGADNKDADNNSTMNLCSPGTGYYNQATGGSVNTAHCYSAATNTRPKPGEWAWVSASVMGDSIVRHYIGASPTGTPTLTYYRPVYLKGNIINPPSNVPADGTRLGSGYIAIQAESHPYKFRKIEVLDLEGCMDKTSSAYRTYFVKSKPSACSGTGMIGPAKVLPRNVDMTREPAGFSFRSPEAGELEVADPSGKMLSHASVAAGRPQYVELARKGLFLVTWKSGAAVARIKWTRI
jgi:Domain of Unknown Function (DUF1080)